MSKRKYRVILSLITILGIISFSFMLFSVFMNSKNNSSIWFPRLFVILPLISCILIVFIFLFYRNQLKEYEQKRRDERITNANIKFHCENIGNHSYKRLIASLYKLGFKARQNKEAYFKRVSDAETNVEHHHILVFRNFDLRSNLGSQINQTVRAIKREDLSNVVIGAIMFVPKFNELQQVEVKSSIKNSLLSSNDSFECPLLLVDLSTGCTFYPISDKKFLLSKCFYFKKLLHFSKKLMPSEISIYKDANEY